MKRIALDFGHNCSNDRGATGIRQEDTLIRETGKKLLTLLKNDGHQVKNVTPYKAESVMHSLRQRVHACNEFNADIFASIHFNAFNDLAHGTEVYYVSEAGKVYAESVVKEIAKLGFYNRGAKLGHFYVIRKTSCPAILIECCFCDNASDMFLYNSTQMAIAIRNGLNLYNRNTYNSGIQYELIIDKATWFKGSTDSSEQLIEKFSPEAFSSDSKIKLDPGTYTVTKFYCKEQRHYYLELKVGLVGFIYEEHGHLKPIYQY